MTRTPVDFETSELRKRLRAAIESSRKAAASRRETLDQAAAAYDELLKTTAAPLARKLANVLRAEGYNFTVFTPAGGLRLASAKSADDFIELVLDTGTEAPEVALRVNRGRGSRVVQYERPVKERTPVEDLTVEDLVQALLEELGRLLER